MSNPPGPPRKRRCASCGEVFISPAVLLQHKTVTGDCRPAQLLTAIGMRYRNGAWEWQLGKKPAKGRTAI